MRGSIIAACAVLALVSDSREQALRDKCFYVQELEASLVGQGKLKLDPNDSSQPAKLRWLKPGDLTFSNPTLDMPFVRAGSIAFVNEVSGAGRYLVSGWGPAQGYLTVVQVLTQPQPGLVLEQFIPLGGIDPVRVCWADQTIFLIDALGQRIASAPWDGTALLPSTFTEVIGTGALPLLQVGAALDLAAATPSGIVVFPFGATSSSGTRVYWSGSQWITEQFPISSGSPQQFGLKDRVLTTPSAGPLTILGPIGSFTIVEEYSGAVVGSGSSTADWQEVIVELQDEMVPGRRHLITSAGLEDFSFVPSVRHGTPRQQPGLRIRVGLVAATHVNDTWSGPGTRLTRNDASAYLGIPASLWVSLRDVNGNDPVTPTPPVPPGTTAFLSPIATVDFVATLDVGKKSLGVGLPIIVPDDPALAGLVMLFQYVAITPDGQSFVASDVFGTTILGESETDHGSPRRSKDASSRGKVWAQMSPDARERALRAGKAWLHTLERRIPGREQSVYETVQSMR